MEKTWQNDLETFEEKVNEVFEGFLESLSGPTYLIDLSKEDEDSEYGVFIEEGFQFVYTDRGHNLARRMQDRLYKLAYKYFPNEIVTIESHLFREL